LGSDFPKKLNTNKIGKIFYKGCDPKVDSYSGFLDNDRVTATGLAKYLKDNNVVDIYVTGLTTDYCVKYTAIDGKTFGFNVYVVEDACRGVKINDVKNAIREMDDLDIKIIKSSQV
jgi:nicotinamidase/pyrazinamidase